MTVHLRSGDALEVCSIIEITKHWVALAVPEDGSPSVRTEIVPYDTLARITVRPRNPRGGGIGFRQDAAPLIVVDALSVK